MAEIGDIIMVRVGGVEYETHIDDRGVQRFRENPEHFLIKSAPKIDTKKWPEFPENHPDLNAMAIKYGRKEFSQRDYAEMNMALGYSVSGFCELHNFNDMLIENPLWNDDPRHDAWIEANIAKRAITLNEGLEIIMERDDVTFEEAKVYYYDWAGIEE